MRIRATAATLLLLVCSLTAVQARDATVLIGPGAYIDCKLYVDLARDVRSWQEADFLFNWVMGYFSARNMFGHGDHPLTVGSSLSPDALKSMLTDQCAEEPTWPVVRAADALYTKLEAKGL